MSFEGYTQNICQNGHFEDRDAYYGLNTCTTCRKVFVWTNVVDDTNGHADGHINSDELWDGTRYRVPAPLESLMLRTYRKPDGTITRVYTCLEALQQYFDWMNKQ